MIDFENALIVALVGVAAGVVNTLVGGGTYLTLPILSFLGLSASEANATNRFAVAFQSLAGIGALTRSGRTPLKAALPFALTAAVGAWPGAQLAAVLPPDQFRAIVGYLLLGSLALLFIKPKEASTDSPSAPRRGWAFVACFLFGIYVGFLGAGVGILILVYLPRLLRIELVDTVLYKVLIVLLTSILASIVFVASGLVDGAIAVPLVIGNIIGGYAGGRLALRHGDRWLRVIVAVFGGALALAMVLGYRP